VTDPRIHERRVRVERERGRRRLRILLGTILAAGLIAGTLAVLHTSLFGARSVLITGAAHTPRGEIIHVTGLYREPPLIDLNTTAMARRLDRLPWVASASVKLDWPSTVAISLTERTPVAASVLPSGRYAVLDASGRVLADERSRPAALALVEPSRTPGDPGSSLGASARSLLAAAAALPVSLLPQVDQIAVSRSDGVVVRLAGGREAVVGDDEALAQKFVSLATVLRRVNLTGISGIDLRVPTSPVLTPLVSPSNVHGKGDG